MTIKQRILLMADLWPAAAAALGCSKEDRERRLAEISAALGRPVASAGDIKTNVDFDRVKSHLLAISQPSNLDAQMRQANMSRTRLLVGIRKRGAEGYIVALSRDKFGTAAWVNLPEFQLIQLRDTLAARASAKRKKVEVPF